MGRHPQPATQAGGKTVIIQRTRNQQEVLKIAHHRTSQYDLIPFVLCIKKIKKDCHSDSIRPHLFIFLSLKALTDISQRFGLGSKQMT